MKKLFSCILALAVMVSCLPVTVLAAGSVRIFNAEDFRTFCDNCRRDTYSQGVTFLLKTDIDLDGEELCVPSFSGSFDGGGHTISGVSLTSAGSRQGLFRTVTAEAEISEEDARSLEKKIRKNKFDFDDFMGQIQQIKKMGNIKDLASMIPGVGKAIKDVDIDDNAFKSIEAIIQSMTPKERQNPDIINQSRRLRIAKGSGTKIEDVNRLMKQFDQTRKMMRMVSGMGNSRMAQMAAAMKMKGGMPKF